VLIIQFKNFSSFYFDILGYEGVITEDTVYIFTAIKTSNLTFFLLSKDIINIRKTTVLLDIVCGI
jgi:hypothetical protein